jgi:hypothetical protein
MIWIILAIIAAGYMVSVAIKKSTDAKIMAAATIEQAKFDATEKQSKTEIENSPRYQILLNASLQFMDYMEEYSRHSDNWIHAKNKLTTSKNLTKADKLKLAEIVSGEKKQQKALQDKWFAEWDKLDKQLDPRHNFLSSHEKLANRWKTYEQQHEAQGKRMQEVGA